MQRSSDLLASRFLILHTEWSIAHEIAHASARVLVLQMTRRLRRLRSQKTQMQQPMRRAWLEQRMGGNAGRPRAPQAATATTDGSKYRQLQADMENEI